jgi:hypothetical protein
MHWRRHRDSRKEGELASWVADGIRRGRAKWIRG